MVVLQPSQFIGEVMIRQGSWFRSVAALYLVTSFCPTVFEERCIRAGRTWKLECLNGSSLFKHFCSHWKMNASMDTMLQQGLLGFFAIALDAEREESLDKNCFSVGKGQGLLFFAGGCLG